MRNIDDKINYIQNSTYLLSDFYKVTLDSLEKDLENEYKKDFDRFLRIKTKYEIAQEKSQFVEDISKMSKSELENLLKNKESKEKIERLFGLANESSDLGLTEIIDLYINEFNEMKSGIKKEYNNQKNIFYSLIKKTEVD